ncbi:hypothetical protein MsAg5_08520 [Methanosarcinaceae archaeon Ag5]|uniref:Uncharacterized protein n=1 Tax=Methanolapillus africanus TaxID=3028297 RepID=A0AAE4MIT5_9EURY|nr:hypothetical protein [Methanosarcinaceae archaeon Ag5]
MSLILFREVTIRKSIVYLIFINTIFDPLYQIQDTVFSNAVGCVFSRMVHYNIESKIGSARSRIFAL